MSRQGSRSFATATSAIPSIFGPYFASFVPASNCRNLPVRNGRRRIARQSIQSRSMTDWSTSETCGHDRLMIIVSVLCGFICGVYCFEGRGYHLPFATSSVVKSRRVDPYIADNTSAVEHTNSHPTAISLGCGNVSLSSSSTTVSTTAVMTARTMSNRMIRMNLSRASTREHRRWMASGDTCR